MPKALRQLGWTGGKGCERLLATHSGDQQFDAEQEGPAGVAETTDDEDQGGGWV